MPITSFKQEWKLTKSTYEKATGKSKPSAKLGGASKKASGLEPACADLDSALKSRDAKAAMAAAATIASAGSAYAKALAEAAKTSDVQIRAELLTMLGFLQNIMKEAREQADALNDGAAVLDAMTKTWNVIIKNYIATPLPKNADVKAFISGKQFGIDLVAGTAAPAQQKAHSEAKQHLVNYVKALGAVKSYKINPTDKKNIKDFWETMATANDHIAVNGLLGSLGDWRLAASGTSQKAQAYNASPLKGVMDGANDALSAENERLAKLQRAFEAQIMK